MKWKVDVRGPWPILICGLKAEEMRGFNRVMADLEAIDLNRIDDVMKEVRYATPRIISPSSFDIDNELRY